MISFYAMILTFVEAIIILNKYYYEIINFIDFLNVDRLISKELFENYFFILKDFGTLYF